jgi:hypothetical protein
VLVQARWLTLLVGSAIVGATLAGVGCKSGAPSTTSENGAVPMPRAGLLGGEGTSCDTPNENCPCVYTQEGLSMPCGTVASESADTIECYKGLRTCQAGKWGACSPVGSTSTLAKSGTLGLSPLGLGAQSACSSNPCDPYCLSYGDTPTGVDAGAKFQLSTDGGLTLVGGVSCAGLPTVDDDGDGWTEAQGDCNDCSAVINPGAYDYPGNGFDDDCDGTIDNAPVSCDSALSMTSTSGDDFAKAIDLCRFTTAAATGAAKTWGVITGTSKLVRANTTSAPNASQYAIMPSFGNATSNGAKKGSSLAVFSSGTARVTGQTGFTTPKGWCGSYNAATTSTVPCGLSWNKAGCPAGTPGNDSSGMSLQVRVPTNAQCMSFRFHYLSSEYPEWLCSAYNDTFVAMLTSKSMVPGTGCCGAAPGTNCNISYGAGNTPVSVNNNLFAVPGCTSCSSAVLSGTGFDGSCSGYIKGGSTGWLYSYAPVTPGEIATFHTSIWDTADNAWDSTVLIDSWDWYPGTCSIATTPSAPTTLPAPPTGTPFLPSMYTRDFEAVCGLGTSPSWRLYSWTSSEPGDAKIAFTVQSSDTLANIGAAPSAALTTSTGHAGPTAGSADVKVALATISAAHARWLRVTMAFSPASNGTSAPTLFDWHQAYDCVPTE